MIFVDSAQWIALHNRRDPRHALAVELLRGIDHEPLLTTNHVCGETWTFLRRKAGHTAAVSFLDAVDASHRLEIVHVSAELERRARTWLRRHDEREYSFVDATSFAVMRSRKVTKVLTFDGDFAAAGFVERGAEE